MKETKGRAASAGQNAVHDPQMTQQIFRDNEIGANLLIAKTMFAAAGLLLVCWLLNTVGVLEISSTYVLPVFLVGVAALVFPAGVCCAFRGEKSWIKYMLLGSITAALAYLDSILTFNAPLLIVMPVVFSCRYYSCQIAVKTAIFTTVLFAVSAWCGAIFNFDNPDMNFANADLYVYVRDVMLLSFLPRWLMFTVFSMFSYEIARYGREMVLKQNEISQQTARVNTELEMAGRIQNQALPAVSALPENRLRRFDLAAEMVPAKEVGGDFYDFFYPDPSHLALMIADVADKGIAASLYMMMSKTLLNSRLSMTLSPGQVLENVNRQLFANSPKGMFVTVWLGVLDLKTGELVTANAGHEYPALRRKNGDFELIRDKHGFVLGGMKSAKFPEHTVQLKEGDTLFVYTDGIPEANDANGRMFELDRMLESLNRHKDCSMDGLIAGIRSDIDRFAAGATQFDDMTMLALQLQEAVEDTGIRVSPAMEEMDPVQAYIRKAIGPDRISSMQEKKIGIAVDEVFSNIVKYSEANEVQVLCEAGSDQIRITFRDDGMPFDPLAKGDPVIPEPRRVGGLGIHIVRNLMDSMEYSYQDNRNTLTLILRTKEKQE